MHQTKHIMKNEQNMAFLHGESSKLGYTKPILVDSGESTFLAGLCGLNPGLPWYFWRYNWTLDPQKKIHTKQRPFTSGNIRLEA